MSAASLKIVVSTLVLSVAFLASVSIAKAESSNGEMKRVEKPTTSTQEAREYMQKRGLSSEEIERREAGMNKLEKTLNVDNLKEYQAKQKAEYEAKRKAVMEKRKTCLAQNNAFMKQKSAEIMTAFTTCIKAANDGADARKACVDARKSTYLDVRAQALAMRKACVTTERAVLGLSTTIPFTGAK